MIFMDLFVTKKVLEWTDPIPFGGDDQYRAKLGYEFEEGVDEEPWLSISTQYLPKSDGTNEPDPDPRKLLKSCVVTEIIRVKSLKLPEDEQRKKNVLGVSVYCHWHYCGENNLSHCLDLKVY